MASKSWDEIVPAAIDRAESASPSDDEALARAARGNPAAFAPLYQRYVRPIYAYCYQRLGSRDLAEDATSAIFIKALAAMPKYRSASFRGWLYTIARNVITDQFRARAIAQLDQAAGLADRRPDPEALALAGDADARVRQLLSQLTPEQREVIELDLAGLTGREIAQVLHRREGAIRASRFRAYKKLRTLLTEEELHDAH